MLETYGINGSWYEYWASLFGGATDSTVVDFARALAFGAFMGQSAGRHQW